MTRTFEEISDQCGQLFARFSARDKMLEDIRKMFHMEWSESPSEDWIKATMSPDAFNAVIGAIRTLVSGEPQISVPFDQNTSGAQQQSEKLEKAARELLGASGRAILRKAHHEAIFSAVLFGEVTISVSKTDEMVAIAGKTKNAEQINRLTAIAKKTPYLFQTYNPQYCYPDHDSLGLRGVLRKVRTTWGDVLDTWGALAEDMGGSRQRYDVVTLNDWYDYEVRCVWLDEGGEALYMEPHELEFMPVISTIAEGSMMFEKPEQQRLPLLYALYKSDIWKRENLALTMMYSLMHARGDMPLWKRKSLTPGSPLLINRTGPYRVLDLMPDEDVTQFADQAIDPSVIQALTLAQGMSQESTLSKASLGQAPNSNMSFSALSLLAGSGRLPLVSPKDAAGLALSSALEIAFRWMKTSKKRTKLYGKGETIDIKPADIPDNFVMTVNIEADLPQDKLQLANVAQLLTGGDDPLVSKEWARSNILNVGQSDAMDKQIYFEKMVTARSQASLQAVQAQAQMALQQQAQQMQAQTQGAPQPQGQPMQGPPPDQMQGVPNEQQNMMQGLPPQGEIGPGMPAQGPQQSPDQLGLQ